MRAYHCIGDRGGQPLHCHEDVELIAVYRGQGRLQVGSALHTTGPEIFSVVCPQEPHAGTPVNAEFAVKVVNIPVDWFRGMGLDWRVLWRKGGFCETPALTSFYNVYQTVEHGRSCLARDEAFLSLHALLRTAPPPAPVEPKRVEQAIALLQERFADDISLSELARGVDLHPSYLCRAFKKTLGLSPHSYQISLRVARAKTLLEKGNSPGEVARAVGFYDQSHLTHHFKRLLAVTPSSVAKRSNSSYT